MNFSGVNFKCEKSESDPVRSTAKYQLQPKLPAQFKGRLPSARQLADAVRELMPPGK